MKVVLYIIPVIVLFGCFFGYQFLENKILQESTSYKKIIFEDNNQEKEIFKIVVIPDGGGALETTTQFYKNLQGKYKHFDSIIFLTSDRSYPIIQSTPFSQTGEIEEYTVKKQIDQISQFFPKSTITPILLNQKEARGVAEMVLQKVIANTSNKRTLIIISTNFSNQVREEIAKLHDQKSIDTLRFGKLEDFDSLEVDCRNCLAIAKVLSLEKGKNDFQLIDRTSRASLGFSGSDIENTSYIFGEFIDKKESGGVEISENNTENGSGVFLFMGDSHWARGFPYYEKKIEGYREKVTQIFYEKYDTKNDLTTKYHRLLSGFDEGVANLEAGIAEPGSCKKSGKSTQMWMDPNLFPWFYELGITMVNTANNHSHDCGNTLFLESKNQFLSGGIIPFGYDEIAFRQIRGKSFAFVGIDTIETKPDILKIQKNIQSLTSSGNLVIVNIHWGVEYSSGHTEKQEEIAHTLIDAGAKLIIGHHPHVVGDTEIYKGIPIYYSLGNFLFDQPFPETLRGLIVGCEVSKNATICTDISVYRNPKDYILSF